MGSLERIGGGTLTCISADSLNHVTDDCTVVCSSTLACALWAFRYWNRHVALAPLMVSELWCACRPAVLKGGFRNVLWGNASAYKLLGKPRTAEGVQAVIGAMPPLYRIGHLAAEEQIHEALQVFGSSLLKTSCLAFGQFTLCAAMAVCKSQCASDFVQDARTMA